MGENSKVECTECNGTGVIEEKMDVYEEDGELWVDEWESTCKACNGTCFIGVGEPAQLPTGEAAQ